MPHIDFTAFLVAVVPLALGVTKATDLIRNAIDKNDTLPKVTWNIVPFVLGVALTLGWSINLAAVAGLTNSKLSGTAGQILTGLAIGGAAGLWHEPLAAWNASSNRP